LVNAIFDAWTTAELERLLRRSAGSPATNWTVIFTLLLVLTFATTIYFVRPITPWVMAAITFVVTVALVWQAGRLHARRVSGSPQALR
jgi:membrane protein YdbS with pleckstrin-like domain